MTPIDVIAVVGPCKTERSEFSRTVAERTGRTHVRASAFTPPDDIYTDTMNRIGETALRGHAVAEFPATVPAQDIIGSIVDNDLATTLSSLICILDASHLLNDLYSDSLIKMPSGAVPQALVTASHIEFASNIVLTRWEHIPTFELSATMALISHLAPTARIHLNSKYTPAQAKRGLYVLGQARPGWVRIVNEQFDPHMTDKRVSATRFESFRPFHPERLSRLLTEDIAANSFGMVVRSAGFFRLATRPGLIGEWQQVGQRTLLNNLGSDQLDSPDAEVLSLGQDIAIIGFDLDHRRLASAFELATLTDKELSLGPEHWLTFEDSLPAWPMPVNDSD
jgi:G3E family GTPase